MKISVFYLVIRKRRLSMPVRWCLAGGLGLTLSLPILKQPALAQARTLVQAQEARSDSTRGYWRLRTQADTRSTSIQFYGPDHRLLYEEIMPERWVRLNRKNQRQFDRLLTQLVSGQLLSATLKTNGFPPAPDELMRSAPRALSKPDHRADYALRAASYRVDGYVSQTGKLYLIVDNPERLRYKIAVLDRLGRVLYEEFTNHYQYRRRLDLADLQGDACRVVVTIDKKELAYTVNRLVGNAAYTLQPAVRATTTGTDAQYPAVVNSALPVTIDL